jgi:hypothetical protein
MDTALLPEHILQITPHLFHGKSGDRFFRLLKLWFLILAILPNGCSPNPNNLPSREAKAESALTQAKTEEDRYHALNKAAKESFNAENFDDARKYATELIALAQKLPEDWNYGNAIHDSNMVLGRIALREHRLNEAKERLLKAGQTPGSPGLDSFGPNMNLAKDLLEQGQGPVVLEYLELCRKFWTGGFGKLDKWEKEIKAGKIPNFGANLVY